ncbi:MAG: hypothetical protein AAFX93_09155 [Verrucomicrobiota bacterium]
MKLKRLLNFLSITGMIGLVSIVPFTFKAYLPNEHLDDSLADVSGIVESIKNERGTKWNRNLVIKLDGDDTLYKSTNPYPTVFAHGLDTPEHIAKGTAITMLLNTSEARGDPRVNGFNDECWREIVGLTTRFEEHFAPDRFLEWHEHDDQLGRYIGPVLTILFAWLVFEGYKQQKPNGYVL